MKIYIYGCNCGLKATYIRRVRACSPNVEIFNSKYDSVARTEHADYLMQSGFKKYSYEPIVVENNTVRRLIGWKP